MTADTGPAGDGAIDIWCNPFTPEWLRKLYHECEDLQEMVERWGPGMAERTRGHPIEEFIDLLDAADVGRVLIPAFQMMSYRTKRLNWDVSVENILPLLAEAPGRFFGLYGINPLERMAGVRRLEWAVREKGFKGAHLHPHGFGLSPSDRAFYPYYAKCVELDVPVLIQMGYSAEAMPSWPGKPGEIDNAALYFPELRIVAAHTGWPWVEELISLALKHRNLYIAATAHAPRYWDPKLVHFLNSRGRGKVMWGTDFPVTTHLASLADISQLGLRDEAHRALVYEVAAKVFRLDESHEPAS